MTKKLFVLATLLLVTLFFTSPVFAESTIENGIKDMGTEVTNSWNKLTGTMQNAGQNVGNTVNDMGNGAMNAMDMNDDRADDQWNNNQDDNNGNNNDQGTDYEATRTNTATATTGGLFGMNSTAWAWWLILAVVAALIVGIIWYNDSKKTTRTRD